MRKYLFFQKWIFSIQKIPTKELRMDVPANMATRQEQLFFIYSRFISQPWKIDLISYFIEQKEKARKGVRVLGKNRRKKKKDTLSVVVLLRGWMKIIDWLDCEAHWQAEIERRCQNCNLGNEGTVFTLRFCCFLTLLSVSWSLRTYWNEFFCFTIKILIFFFSDTLAESVLAN